MSGEIVGGAVRRIPHGRSTRRRPPSGALSTSTAPHALQKRVVAGLS
jgi:hypothetical protein